MANIEHILTQLGGASTVARKLGISLPAVSQWKRFGIPQGRKFDLLTLAQREKVILTIADLEAADMEIERNA